MQFEEHFPDFHLNLFAQLIESVNHKKNLGLYHDITRDRLEFMGDRIAFEATKTSGDATILVSKLQANRAFSCYMEKMEDACTLLGIRKDSKGCSDIFEMGALFYYYFYKTADYNVIHKIDNWMRAATIFSDHVAMLIKNNNDICSRSSRGSHKKH